jgi:hypothetical protein
MEPGGHRPEFLQALVLLGQACARVAARGLPMPVLVGGAVVEWYSVSAYMSGDFDLNAPDPAPMADELLASGFRVEDRQGWLARGFYHPQLDLGVEFIGDRLFDGHHRGQDGSVLGRSAPWWRITAPGAAYLHTA